jgi:hypothetical protein
VIAMKKWRDYSQSIQKSETIQRSISPMSLPIHVGAHSGYKVNERAISPSMRNSMRSPRSKIVGLNRTSIRGLTDSETIHLVLGGPVDAVFVWNHLSDDADLHPYRNENTDSLDTITNFERRHGGTSYTGRPSEFGTDLVE